MEFRLYPLTDESRLQEICDLFAQGLGETTVAYWKWKHFTENGLPQSIMIVAEDNTGKIVGMYALQPMWYCNSKERVLVSLGEDLVVDKTFRGTGLVKRLRQYGDNFYIDQRADFWAGYANPISFIIFQKYGAKNCGDIYSYQSQKTILPPLFPKTNYTHDGWEISVCDRMPSDLFFQTGDTSFRMEKNASFMEWKFEKNPNQKFKWLTIRNNGVLKGYMVFHVNRGRFRKAVNIHDWDLMSDVSDQVLKRAVDILRSMGNWVSLWGRYDDAVLARWKMAGIGEKSTQGTHFLLCPYGVKELPDQWHLTRADLDF